MENSKKHGTTIKATTNTMEEKYNGETNNSQWQSIQGHFKNTLGYISHFRIIRDKVSAVGFQLNQVIKVGGKDDTGDGQ